VMHEIKTKEMKSHPNLSTVTHQIVKLCEYFDNAIYY
jgi:hypothetical protein